MKIQGNTVLITVGGSGIGLALAKVFLDYQNKVIIVGRDEQKLTSAMQQFPELNIITADITNEDDRQRMVTKVRECYSELNILINNAGIAFFYDLQSGFNCYELFRLEVETNYLAPARLIELFRGQLGGHSASAVVNISTIAAYLPLTVMPGYSASKSALHSYSNSLRQQLTGSSIKIFEVFSPPVDTEMVKNFEMVKLSPEKFALAVIHGVKMDNYEMYIGEANIMRWMERIAPRFSAKLSQKYMLKALAK